MPELPEVETVRRMLDPRIRSRPLRGAWTFGTPKFEQALHASGTVTQVSRRGKYLLIGLQADRGERDQELVIHLGMTGRLSLAEDRSLVSGPTSSRPHLRASWALDGGESLMFDDARRFGRVAVVDAGDYSALAGLRDLGPEPWDPAFTPASLRHAVVGSRRAVKTLLLGQRVVAGVGNIYADEALWMAAISPRRRGRLSTPAATRLHSAIREVLEAGLEHGGTTLRDYRDLAGDSGEHQLHLACYGRAGLPCRRCGVQLQRYELDGRSTTACPVCQR